MEDFKHYLKLTSEYGVVSEVKDSLLVVEGLLTARLNESVIFENGERGQVIALTNEGCQAVVFEKTIPTVGEKVVRTGRNLAMKISDNIIGSMIDPFGQQIFTTGKYSRKSEEVELFVETHSRIWEREKITKPLETGVGLVDMLLPLGEGQKELVVGDRKTGKTSFLLTTVKNQIEKGKVVIFASIGKKKTDIKKLLQYFLNERTLEKMVFVTSAADDPVSMIYLTPFAAMTVAEHFKAQGRDSLVVMDDLSTHAKIYREISLTSERFPGRESYPGDIFYIHASLLERTGNFVIKNEKLKIKKSVSITCLPVAESTEGDLTGYITTNLMGITDGHIFFDRTIFTKGVRPAINVMLSVTRVGRQTQNPLLQDINHQVTAFLSEYESLKNLSHFGAELSDTVKTKIIKGERLEAVFEQNFGTILPVSVQIILFVVAFSEEFFKVDIRDFKNKMIYQAASGKNQGVINEIVSVNNFSGLVKKLKSNLNKVC